MPYLGLLCPEPLPLQQSTADQYLHRRYSNTVLSQSLWGLWSWCTHGLFEPSEHLWWVWGLILNTILPLLPSYWSFSFVFGCGVSPHSCSRAVQLPLQPRPSCWASLPLDLGYLLTVAPVPCSRHPIKINKNRKHNFHQRTGCYFGEELHFPPTCST